MIIQKIKKIIESNLGKMNKYTNTDMVYLGKNIGWINIGNGLSSLASLGLVYVFGNFISQHDYGIYQYVISIIGVISTITMPGINTAVIKAIADGSDMTFIDGLKTKIRWGVFASAISLLIAIYYTINNDIVLSFSFFIISIFIPFFESFTIYSSFLEGKKDFKKSAIYSFLISFVRVIVMIGVILITKNIIIIIASYITITTIIRGVATFIVIQKINKKTNTDKEIIKYGKHLSLMRIISGGISSLDNILLFQFLGSIELAIYSFAKTPVTKIAGAITPITSLAYPKFAVTPIEKLKKTLPKKLLLLFLLMLLISITYILISPFLFSILLPNYINSIKFSQIFAISLIFIPQKVVGSVLTAHKQQKSLYVLSITNPIIRILSLIILLPLFGINGVIWSFLIGLLFNGILSYYYFFTMKS